MTSMTFKQNHQMTHAMHIHRKSIETFDLAETHKIL